MLKLLRDIKYTLIMDALISKEIRIDNNSSFYKGNSKNNIVYPKGNNKSKRKARIRK